MSSKTRLPIWTAAALLFVAGAAAAHDAPTQCTTNGGSWTVNVSAPFQPMTCPADSCTGLTYNIIPRRGETPDHVAVLVDHSTPIVIPPSTYDTAACAGDNITGLGARDCSSQTARVNQNQQKTGPFDLVVQGTVVPIGGSIVVKKGNKVEQCRIATLGVEGYDPHSQVSTSETIQFKGCTMTIPVDPITRQPGIASLTGTGCKFVANGDPIESLDVTVNGHSLGQGKWISENAAFSNGDDSCSTRTVSGRLYSVCDCKSLTDPKPPCL